MQLYFDLCCNLRISNKLKYDLYNFKEDCNSNIFNDDIIPQKNQIKEKIV